MPFARPTLKELFVRIQADFAERTDGDSYVQRSFEYVASWALAGVAHGLHGHLDWISKEISPATCGEKMLARWAQIFTVPRKQPTFASGYVQFSGANGSTIPSGTAFQRNDGTKYITTADGTIASGFAIVGAIAQIAAAAGNTSGASPVTLVSPVLGVATAGVFTVGGAVGGSDLEKVEIWRYRVLERIANQPRGGNSADYIAWAKATPGVTVREAYVQPYRMGPGTVGVSFTVVGEDPIPTEPQRAAMEEFIDALRPIDMRGFEVFVPIAETLPYSIQISPYTAEVRAAIRAALLDLHTREARMGATLLISHIREAVSTAPGEFDHVMVSPSSNVTPTTDDHLLVTSAGSISFSPIP